MTALYLAVGAAELGVRHWREIVATGLGLGMALGVLGCMCCQRYVAEIEDTSRADVRKGRPTRG